MLLIRWRTHNGAGMSRDCLAHDRSDVVVRFDSAPEIGAVPIERANAPRHLRRSRVGQQRYPSPIREPDLNLRSLRRAHRERERFVLGPPHRATR